MASAVAGMLPWWAPGIKSMSQTLKVLQAGVRVREFCVIAGLDEWQPIRISRWRNQQNTGASPRRATFGVPPAVERGASPSDRLEELPDTKKTTVWFRDAEEARWSWQRNAVGSHPRDAASGSGTQRRHGTERREYLGGSWWTKARWAERIILILMRRPRKSRSRGESWRKLAGLLVSAVAWSVVSFGVRVVYGVTELARDPNRNDTESGRKTREQGIISSTPGRAAADQILTPLRFTGTTTEVRREYLDTHRRRAAADRNVRRDRTPWGIRKEKKERDDGCAAIVCKI
ncbi:hypothetical protein FB451DRAFT_1185584 [Mycena latifolia]|nr:hypothetical protein FB451DRAFT_1185584 [Mycena latifolia]